MERRAAELAEQIGILTSGLAAQARAAGLDDVAVHLEAAAKAARARRAPDSSPQTGKGAPGP